MLFIVVVRAVITHDRQQGEPMVSRSVERAGYVEKVAIRLQIHTDLARTPQGQCYPQRCPETVPESGSPTAAAEALGLPLPYPLRPASGRAVGQYPILIP